MKPTAWFAALAAMTASCNALAVGDVAQVTIVDCSSGAVLTPHLHHGEYWVAGRPGTTYAIEIHNRLDQRVLAVTSVDGVNVISGATAAWNQTGYVFGPQQDYAIARAGITNLLNGIGCLDGIGSQARHRPRRARIFTRRKHRIRAATNST